MRLQKKRDPTENMNIRVFIINGIVVKNRSLFIWKIKEGENNVNIYL